MVVLRATEAGDDVWPGDSSDEKEIGEARSSSSLINVFPGNIINRVRNEHIRGALKVDRFWTED